MMRSTWVVVVLVFLAAWRAVPTGAQNSMPPWLNDLTNGNSSCGPGSYGSFWTEENIANITGPACDYSRSWCDAYDGNGGWSHWSARDSLAACKACYFASTGWRNGMPPTHPAHYHGINYQPERVHQTAGTTQYGMHYPAGYREEARCSMCRIGYKASHTFDCHKCPAGTASNATDAATSAACQACPAGKKSNALTGATNCTDCGPGHYQASSGQSTCTPCAAGRVSSAIAATSSSVCTACPAGRGSLSGSADCTECGPGRTWSNTAWSLQFEGICRPPLVEGQYPWHAMNAANRNCQTSDNPCSTKDKCEAICGGPGNASLPAIAWGYASGYSCTCCSPGYTAPGGTGDPAMDHISSYDNTYRRGGCADCPKGTYKAGNHGICQPCATGTTSRPGSTSCFAAATTTQEIAFAIKASNWTGLVKSLAESAYAMSLNIWDVTNKVILPDYIVSSRAVAASHRSGISTVTFTTTMPAAAEATVKDVAAMVTGNTMNTNQNMIKLFADVSTYGSVQPPSVTSVVNSGGPAPTMTVNSGGPAPTMTPSTSPGVQLIYWTCDFWCPTHQRCNYVGMQNNAGTRVWQYHHDILDKDHSWKCRCCDESERCLERDYNGTQLYGLRGNQTCQVCICDDRP